MVAGRGCSAGQGSRLACSSCFSSSATASVTNEEKNDAHTQTPKVYLTTARYKIQDAFAPPALLALPPGVLPIGLVFSPAWVCKQEGENGRGAALGSFRCGGGHGETSRDSSRRAGERPLAPEVALLSSVDVPQGRHEGLMKLGGGEARESPASLVGRTVTPPAPPRPNPLWSWGAIPLTHPLVKRGGQDEGGWSVPLQGQPFLSCPIFTNWTGESLGKLPRATSGATPNGPVAYKRWDDITSKRQY